MRDYADEVHLHARLYAMRSRLLTRKDYDALVRNPASLSSEMAAAVFDTPLVLQKIFREQIAPILVLAEAYSRYIPLFLAFFRQYEAQNIKMLLAKLFGRQGLDQWYDIHPYAVASQDELRKADSIEALVTLLKGTYLEEIFKEVSGYDQMDARVDVCIIRQFYAASVDFTKDAKLDFEALLNKRMDIMQAMFSARLRRTYQWNAENIRVFLKKGWETSGGNQKGAAEDLLLRRLEEARTGGASEPALSDIERDLEQDDYNRISQAFHRDFFSVVCVLAYLWLMDCQIRNLCKMVEGRRFGFSPEQIMSKMVCGI